MKRPKIPPAPKPLPPPSIPQQASYIAQGAASASLPAFMRQRPNKRTGTLAQSRVGSTSLLGNFGEK